MCFLYENRRKTGFNTQIELNTAKEFLGQMLSVSPYLRSVVMGGPGEPLEYTYFNEIIKFFGENGLSIHVYSTGNDKLNWYADHILKYVRLFRVSLDASCQETYKLTHGKADFAERLENVRNLVRRRDMLPSEIILGVHFVIQKHNVQEVRQFGELAKSLCVDYVEFVFESYYVVNGMTNAEEQFAVNQLGEVKLLQDEMFSVISPLDRKKHQLVAEKVSKMTAGQVERHCHDLRGRLNFSVEGFVSLCAKERFNSQSVFNLGTASVDTANAFAFGVKSGFSTFLPKGEINVGCRACFCNNYNYAMNTLIKFTTQHHDAECHLVS